MSARHFSLISLAIAIGLMAWFLRSRPDPALVISKPPAANLTERLSGALASKPVLQNPAPSSATAPAEPETTVSLAAELNAPGGNITRDLQMLDDVLNSWRLDFPRIGNPVGDNAEITAALAGDNPLRLPLISRQHRAINSTGELTDRWGTPFRFHALAGDRMEIRSAGPDKKLGTADDAVLTPP